MEFQDKGRRGKGKENQWKETKKMRQFKSRKKESKERKMKKRGIWLREKEIEKEYKEMMGRLKVKLTKGWKKGTMKIDKIIRKLIKKTRNRKTKRKLRKRKDTVETNKKGITIRERSNGKLTGGKQVERKS